MCDDDQPAQLGEFRVHLTFPIRDEEYVGDRASEHVLRTAALLEKKLREEYFTYVPDMRVECEFVPLSGIIV